MPLTTPGSFIEGDSNFNENLKHKKCKYVNRVREQISSAEKKYSEMASESSNTDPSPCFPSVRLFGCWSHAACCIFVILSVLALAWACILYGTIIGAALCTHINNGQFIPWFKIPGLQWQNKNDGKAWKVF